MNYDTVLPRKILRRYRRPQTSYAKEWLKFGAFILALCAVICALACAFPDRDQRMNAIMPDAILGLQRPVVHPKEQTPVCTP